MVTDALISADLMTKTQGETLSRALGKRWGEIGSKQVTTMVETHKYRFNTDLICDRSVVPATEALRRLFEDYLADYSSEVIERFVKKNFSVMKAKNAHHILGGNLEPQEMCDCVKKMLSRYCLRPRLRIERQLWDQYTLETQLIRQCFILNEQGIAQISVRRERADFFEAWRDAYPDLSWGHFFLGGEALMQLVLDNPKTVDPTYFAWCLMRQDPADPINTLLKFCAEIGNFPPNERKPIWVNLFNEIQTNEMPIINGPLKVLNQPTIVSLESIDESLKQSSIWF